MSTKAKAGTREAKLEDALRDLVGDMTIIECTRCDGTGKRLAHPDEACHQCSDCPAVSVAAVLGSRTKSTPMNKVTLFCRKCKCARKTPADKSDPKGTVRIECLCPKCDNGGFDDLAYFDATGKQLEASGAK